MGERKDDFLSACEDVLRGDHVVLWQHLWPIMTPDQKMECAHRAAFFGALKCIKSIVADTEDLEMYWRVSDATHRNFWYQLLYVGPRHTYKAKLEAAAYMLQQAPIRHALAEHDVFAVNEQREREPRAELPNLARMFEMLRDSDDDGEEG